MLLVFDSGAHSGYMLTSVAGSCVLREGMQREKRSSEQTRQGNENKTSRSQQRRTIRQPSVVQHLPERRLWEEVREDSTKEGKTMIKITINLNDTGLCAIYTSTPEKGVCSMCLEIHLSHHMIQQRRAYNHVFHQQCFEDWVVNRQTNLVICNRKLPCPMCRAESRRRRRMCISRSRQKRTLRSEFEIKPVKAISTCSYYI
jgi:hypothetical protein